MLSDQQFQEYLDLCDQIAQRLEREGVWPWRDSTLSEDLLESENK